MKKEDKIKDLERKIKDAEYNVKAYWSCTDGSYGLCQYKLRQLKEELKELKGE